MTWPAANNPRPRAAPERNVRTAIRARPLSGGEECFIRCEGHCVTAVSPHDGSERKFSFDDVLGPDTTAEDACERLLQPLLPDFLSGAVDNTCVVLYGQTGSGKPATMDAMLAGAAAAIFRAPTQLVRVSMVQIYNERVFDALGWRTGLRVRPTSAGPAPGGVSDRTAASADELLALAHQGRERMCANQRALGGELSSRQHTLLSLRLEPAGSTLTLVELAGSERVSKSGATGDRLREAQAINRGLSALGNLIQALSSPDAHHIPYRDSTITYLIQFALGGNCATLFVGHVSSCNFDESLSTMRYVDRAGCIKNRAGPPAGGGGRLPHILAELELLRTELSSAAGEEAEALQGCVAALEAVLV